MTDAELEQLLSDKEYAYKQFTRHQAAARKWERRWLHLSRRIDEEMRGEEQPCSRKMDAALSTDIEDAS